MKNDFTSHGASVIESSPSDMLTVRNRWEYVWLRAKNLFLDSLGWGLEKLRVPARLKEFEFVDPETDETIFLSTGRRYSVLHVRGKQFFFNRVSGVLDGTCTSFVERVPNGLELRD